MAVAGSSAEHLVPASAHVVHELAQPGDVHRRGALVRHVEGQQVALDPGRQPGGSAHDGVPQWGRPRPPRGSAPSCPTTPRGGSRGTAGAPPRSRRPRSAARAPAGPPGSRSGRTPTVPRAPCRGDRCCRGSSADGAGRRDESISSIWSASLHHPIRHPLGHPDPVIFSTASAMLSRCWMLTVVTTAMSASMISRTSCQRFSCGPSPGRWCARARRPAPPRACAGSPPRGPSPRSSTPR